MLPRIAGFALLIAVSLIARALPAVAEVKTWDGRHNIEKVEVTVVYFLPKDGVPLPDWRERVDYFARRIERFHQREYDGQSTLAATVVDEPFRSTRTTAELRKGDGDAIFFKTLREVDAALKFGRDDNDDAFPILLVLSDINWRPLEDFYRLRTNEDGSREFEGQLIDGVHFPGAASGGARATYLADRGVGWGLVSADGWRVPYRGTDCVVYHEGVGHTVGLPHPEPGNGSVMSFGQYRGWISESWLDDDQKRRLGWTPPKEPFDREHDLFSTFRALPEPQVPAPGENVSLVFDWPDGAEVATCRVRVQTALFGPWCEVPLNVGKEPPESILLGTFDRPTPVAYRVDATTAGGDSVELWGYFQVRADADTNPVPVEPLVADASSQAGEPQPAVTFVAGDAGSETDLLANVDVKRDAVAGTWTLADGRLESPKQYGARLELPGDVPEEYLLTVVAEPLDEPNGLILGQRSGENRFLVLLHYGAGDSPSSALENIDGRNVGNESTFHGPLFRRGRPSQILCEVRKTGVRVVVDGRLVVDWKGAPEQLTHGDYWNTPHNTLFLGAYDCRYRFHRVDVTALK